MIHNKDKCTKLSYQINLLTTLFIIYNINLISSIYVQYSFLRFTFCPLFPSSIQLGIFVNTEEEI